MSVDDPGASAVAEILAANRGRKSRLVRLKFRRMSQDAFAFFRGTDHLFAGRWDELSPPDPGPAALICGDLHLENFGAYRADDGDFLFDINDFDEALVAPVALDVVRCTTSILLAAQVWRLTPVQAMQTVLGFLDRYRAEVAESVATGRVGEASSREARGPIGRLLERPVRGDEARFLARLTERSGGGGRRIRLVPGRFRAVGRPRRDIVAEAVERYGREAGRTGDFRALDVAARIAGIGSLGLPRYAVLVGGGGSPAGCRILDIKAIGPPALLRCDGASRPEDGGSDARRAVLAQRRLQAKPTAGLDVLAIDGDEFRMRELIPEENRTSLDRLRRRPKRLRHAVEAAGRLTARAHLRGLRAEVSDRSGELARWTAGPGLDAAIASAVRYADRTRRDYRAFRAAISDGRAELMGADR